MTEAMVMAAMPEAAAEERVQSVLMLWEMMSQVMEA
jgi:hypothetical protein